MVLDGGIDHFSCHEFLEDKSPEVNDEEYVLATVTSGQEREDLSHGWFGDANPRWLKLCRKTSRKKAMRTESQETLDLNAVHKAASISHDTGHGSERAEKRRTREQLVSSGNGSKTHASV